MNFARLFTVSMMGFSLCMSSFSLWALNSQKETEKNPEIVTIKKEPKSIIEWIKKQIKKNDVKAERLVKEKNKARKKEDETKKMLYGERYELSVQIAKIATRLMEEHSCPEAYVTGAELLLQMAGNREDTSVLRGLVSESESKKEAFKEYKKLGKNFTEDEITDVTKKIENIVQSYPLLKGTKSYLLSALEKPFMDCTREGGGFLYGAGIIGGASIHIVNCKSHYGRHIPYTFTAIKLGVGLAFAGHGKASKVEQGEDGAVLLESYKLPYSLVSKNKPHFAGGFTAALGLGVNMERENFTGHFGSKNGVVGGVAFGLTGGVGFVKAWPEQVPEFENLFMKMKMNF
jgi:hypothetical protein